MRTLILTVGFPRSGKSTWATNTGLPIVSSDAIRKEIGCYPFDKKREPEVWNLVDDRIMALMGSGTPQIILDSTALKTSFRWYYKQLVQSFDGIHKDVYGVKYAVIGTSKEECIRRALREGNDALVGMIEQMARYATWPTENLLPIEEHLLKDLDLEAHLMRDPHAADDGKQD